MFALSFCIGPNSVSPNTQENRQKGGPLRKNARAIKTRWREAAAHGREGPNAIPVGRDAQGYTFPVRLLRTYRNMVKKPVSQCLAHSKMTFSWESTRGRREYMLAHRLNHDSDSEYQLEEIIASSNKEQKT